MVNLLSPQELEKLLRENRFCDIELVNVDNYWSEKYDWAVLPQKIIVRGKEHHIDIHIVKNKFQFAQHTPYIYEGYYCIHCWCSNIKHIDSIHSESNNFYPSYQANINSLLKHLCFYGMNKDPLIKKCKN